MKNTRLSISYQLPQTSALCWSPVAALRSGSHNVFNMIDTGKEYIRVRKGYDG
jgi:hypothetical protein